MFPSLLGTSGSALFLIALGALVVWAVVLTWCLVRTVGHYRRLVVGSKGEHLQDILERVLRRQEALAENLSKAETALEKLRYEGRVHIQHIGFVRFNPFEETGGDQSFVAAFLDANKNGLVVSSLHSRAGTRVYAKAVRNGKGLQHALSEEEEKAVATSDVAVAYAIDTDA